MFIELEINDGRKTLVRIGEIERIEQTVTNNEVKVFTKNGYFFTCTPYETIKRLIKNLYEIERRRV